MDAPPDPQSPTSEDLARSDRIVKFLSESVGNYHSQLREMRNTLLDLEGPSAEIASSAPGFMDVVRYLVAKLDKEIKSLPPEEE